MKPKFDPAGMRPDNRWTRRFKRRLDHAGLRQFNDQCLTDFLAIDPQFVCDRVTYRVPWIPGTGEVQRHLAEPASFRSCGEMTVSVVHCPLD